VPRAWPPEAPSAAAWTRLPQETAIWRGRRRKRASASGGPPRLAQRLPANQRAPEREGRRVDVGPLVVADAQATELVEPGKRPFHDPPPPTQATPMLRAAHGQQGRDVTSSETAPNGGRVVAAIPEHTVRPLAAVAPVRRAAGESHPPTPAPLVSRSGSRRSSEPRAARPARRRSDGACSHAWRFDKIPQRIWKQRGGHTCLRYLADEDQVSEVLLHALKPKAYFPASSSFSFASNRA
jgi:hypothetical protein